MIEWLFYLVIALPISGGDTVFIPAIGTGDTAHASLAECKGHAARYVGKTVSIDGAPKLRAICDPRYGAEMRGLPEHVRPPLPPQEIIGG